MDKLHSCSICGETRLEMFNVDRHRKDGLQSLCIACKRVRQRIYYHKDIEQSRLYYRNFKHSHPNPERDKAYMAKWRRAHPEKVKTYAEAQSLRRRTLRAQKNAAS